VHLTRGNVAVVRGHCYLAPGSELGFRGQRGAFFPDAYALPRYRQVHQGVAGRADPGVPPPSISSPLIGIVQHASAPLDGCGASAHGGIPLYSPRQGLDHSLWIALVLTSCYLICLFLPDKANQKSLPRRHFRPSVPSIALAAFGSTFSFTFAVLNPLEQSSEFFAWEQLRSRPSAALRL
jgi:hypothetical protein